MQTVDTHVINQTYRQKYFQAGLYDINWHIIYSVRRIHEYDVVDVCVRTDVEDRTL